jgi:hypothetical protein
MPFPINVFILIFQGIPHDNRKDETLLGLTFNIEFQEVPKGLHDFDIVMFGSLFALHLHAASYTVFQFEEAYILERHAIEHISNQEVIPEMEEFGAGFHLQFHDFFQPVGIQGSLRRGVTPPLNAKIRYI